MHTLMCLHMLQVGAGIITSHTKGKRGKTASRTLSLLRPPSRLIEDS